MSDNFIEEIKEEIRNDQIQRIWRDYGHVIVGIVIAIIIATIAYVSWHSYQDNKVTEQTVAFESALDQGQGYDAIKADSSKGYQFLATLLSAQKNSVAEATKDLNALADETTYHSFYRDLARLQAIMRKFDDTNGKELLSDLEMLVDKPSVIQAQALELQGYAYMKLNAFDKAIGVFQAVANHSSATQSMVVRARAMVEQLSTHS